MSETTENHTITNIGSGLTKAVMHCNPVTGFVQTIYDEYASKQWQQRREKWEETLEAELQNIKDDIDFNKISSISNFAQILANAAQGAMCDLEEDKIAMYVNVVINTIRKEKEENITLHIFLNLLRKYSCAHIKILNFIANQRQYIKEHSELIEDQFKSMSYEKYLKTGGAPILYPHVIGNFCKSIKLDTHIWDLIIRELYNDKMIRVNSFWIQDNAVTNPNEYKTATYIGKKFLAFIEHNNK